MQANPELYFRQWCLLVQAVIIITGVKF